MSFGQLYVVWSTLCHLVKFFMSTGQLYVVWSSFICRLDNFMSSGQLYVNWSSFLCRLVNYMSFGQVLGLPLHNTRSEAGALPLEVRIEKDSDRKFSESKFKVFLKTTFFLRFMLPCSLWAENIFFDFRSPHIPFDTRFWTRGTPL